MTFPSNTTEPASDEHRRATRFFWCWLIVATAMSVIGNIAHALLHAPAGSAWLAAGAALVPPVVLLAATHSVSALVRAHISGAIYWAALTMTLALAACAFVLSFDALRSLAIGLGLPASIAWLWPCAIDVAIAQATLCLLSLSRRKVPQAVSSAVAGIEDVTDPPVDITVQTDPLGEDGGPLVAVEGKEGADEVEPVSETADDPPIAPDINEAAVRRWSPIAESLVREGVTSKGPEVVAAILAQREAGMPPSTIGRANRVHHTTVGRILSAADSRAG